jgi:hypothetical protein
LAILSKNSQYHVLDKLVQNCFLAHPSRLAFLIENLLPLTSLEPVVLNFFSHFKLQCGLRLRDILYVLSPQASLPLRAIEILDFTGKRHHVLLWTLFMKPRFGKLPDQAEAKYNRLTFAEAEEAVRRVIGLGDSEVLLGVLEVLQTYTKE